MSHTTKDRVIDLIRSGFVRLPWADPGFRPDKASDDTFLMKDLGLHPDDYADFVEEFASEFSMPAIAPLYPKDESVRGFRDMAECRRWPMSWMTP